MTHHAPLSVVLVEDHELFRRSIARAIERAPHLHLVGEAADGLRGVELITAIEPDVAVIDLRLPGLDAIGVCGRLAARRPPLATRTLVVSAFDEPELLWRATGAGAHGYVDKGVGPARLCTAITVVGLGGHAHARVGSGPGGEPADVEYAHRG